MKRRITYLAVTLACIIGVTGFFIHRSRGTGELTVSDVTRMAEKTIRAPFFPFRTGSLYVTVHGQLDGGAQLVIISNHGRNVRTEPLSGVIEKRTIGGPEEWVDDLSVRFEPGTAKQGHLTIRMVCGK
jgi:hypothetical protein